MRDAHVALGWALVISNGLVGAWALGAHLEPRLRHRAMWGAVIVAELIVIVQVLTGVIHLTSSDAEPAEFHELYAPFSLSYRGGYLNMYALQTR